jgi:hypothetical protein
VTYLLEEIHAHPLTHHKRTHPLPVFTHSLTHSLWTLALTHLFLLLDGKLASIVRTDERGEEAVIQMLHQHELQHKQRHQGSGENVHTQ